MDTDNENGGYTVSTTCTYEWETLIPSDNSYVRSPTFESTIVRINLPQSDDDSSSTSQRSGAPIEWKIYLEKLDESGSPVTGEKYVNLGFTLYLKKIPKINNCYRKVSEILKCGKVAVSLLVGGKV